MENDHDFDHDFITMHRYAGMSNDFFLITRAVLAIASLRWLTVSVGPPGEHGVGGA